MKEIDIIQQIKSGEVSRVQFKERLLDNYDIGCELVAFSNARGGTLVVGVKDKTGSVNPLSYQEVQETTSLLGNIASENVVPSILVDVETIPVDGGSLVLAHIKEGLNKPYHDNRGIVWVKNGADKRKVFDNAELAEMMTDCGSFSPDEAGVRDATVKDLDENTIKIFLGNKFEKVLARKGLVGDAFREASLDTVCFAIASGHNGEKLLRNLRFIRPDGKITVAAMLLFGKYTQRWLPVMTAKCICFVGNSLGGTQFRDKVNDADIEGNLLHQFETIMDFFTRNLRHIQIGDEFNSKGVLEIPYTSLVEFTVNALVHRSLNAKAPIRVFIFDDRIEIHSPGTLPNGLTVDDIVMGTSMPRNMFLFTNAIHLLPYTGAGSGMLRALSENVKVSFTNNDRATEFVVTINRPESNQLTADSDTKLRHSDTFNTDSDTKFRYSDTSLDTDSDTRRPQITNKQRDIVNFCSVPRSSKEILERAGVTYHSKNIQTYIMSLIEAGYLEMTNPEHPNASNQKYRRSKK
ncbi:AAA family ATPase [Bacteroides sp. AF18-33]|uniref:RNA-binding domain-containing protein n=1 Tax=Bacteroides TaxID=816 RepID=UPI000E731554|nr:MULTISPECIES: RNA-binding domain-containing protein [Bacteroides]MCE8474890.1 putative DNA binding domain-containing protein [Bacteroides uniformis]RJV49288.1 AAA family ATPase [Bacteroides sp. AF18-33]